MVDAQKADGGHPLLDISQKACVDRMKKLVEFGILDYRFVKQGGTFSLYAFGPNYINLIRSTGYGVPVQPDTGYPVNHTEGGGSTGDGVSGQPDNKDNPVKDSSVIDNISYIVEYLNKKAGRKFLPTTKDTQRHISARLAEGYKLEHFEQVIDKKCAQWLGDPKMDEFLRPSTLFGPKFESYLNAPAPRTPAGTGPRIDPGKTDLDDIF